jgi:ankyrin repeat protein
MWKKWLIRGIAIILVEAMLQAMQSEDDGAVRSAVGSWPSPLNTAFDFRDAAGGAGVVASQNTSTILFWALARKNFELADWLIDQGANVNVGQTAVWSDGRVSLFPPLVLAVQTGRVGLVKHFLDKGATVNLKTADGNTPLHYAVSSGRQDIVDMLLAKGADVAAKDVNGKTPLKLATQYGLGKIAEDLRKAGAKE